MGPGRSQEAPYNLKAGIPAGNYHVICDAIIIRPVDVTFDLVHRSRAGDVTLATWMQHFEPLPDGVYEAQAYEIDQAAPAASHSRRAAIVAGRSVFSETVQRP